MFPFTSFSKTLPYVCSIVGPWRQVLRRSGSCFSGDGADHGLPPARGFARAEIHEEELRQGLPQTGRNGREGMLPWGNSVGFVEQFS